MRLRAMTVLLMSLVGCAPDDRYSVPPGDSAGFNQTTDQHAILTQILRDVLTNPQLEVVRREYSERGVKRFALANNSHKNLPWPKDFKPRLHGYECTYLDADENKDAENTPPLLAVRLEKYDPTAVGARVPFEGNVEICLFNAGGYKGKDKVSVGGTRVFYLAKRIESGWAVEWVSMFSQ